MSGGKRYAHQRYVGECAKHMQDCPDCVEHVLAHIEGAPRQAILGAGCICGYEHCKGKCDCDRNCQHCYGRMKVCTACRDMKTVQPRGEDYAALHV